MTEKTHEIHMPCPFWENDCKNSIYHDRCVFKKDGITVREGGQTYILKIYYDCERSRK